MKSALAHGVLGCFVVSLLSLGATGCSETDSTRYDSRTGECWIFEPGDEYIGGMFPYGDAWNDGKNWEIAAKLALDEINQSADGFKDGKQMGLLICNSACNIVQGVEVFDELTDNGPKSASANGLNIQAIVGPGCSIVAEAISSRVKPAGRLIISPSTESRTLKELTQQLDDDLYYRLVGTEDSWAVPQGIFLHRQGYRKLALAYNQVDHVSTLYALLVGDAFSDEGGELVDVPFTHTDADIVNGAEVLSRIDQPGGPDAILLSSLVPGAVLVFQASLTYQWTHIPAPHWEFMTGFSVNDFAEQVGSTTALEGKGGFESMALNDALAQAFRYQFEQAMGRSPDSSYVDKVYDAIYLVAAASFLATDLGDGRSIRDGVRQLSAGDVLSGGQWTQMQEALRLEGQMDYDGVSGNCDFDQYGEVTTNVRRWTFVNGQVHRETENNCFQPDLTPCD